MKHRRFGTLLCLLVALACALATTAWATAWNGSIDTGWYHSTDTHFEIGTAEELAGLAAMVSYRPTDVEKDTFANKTITLTTDIDLGDMPWAPIGSNANNAFQGVFDGGNHVISGLSIPEENAGGYTYYKGLFGYVDGGTVQNVTVRGAITMEGVATGIYAGGMVGSMGNGSVINHCYTYVDINLTTNSENNNTSVGGIVGENWGGTVTNCYATGDVKVAATYNGYNVTPNAGGVVGYNDGMVQNCYAMGNITAIGHDNNYNVRAGGVVGKNNKDGILQNCYATGTANVETQEPQAGGIVGGNYGAVTNCYWSSTGITAGFGQGEGVDCDSFTGTGTTTNGDPAGLHSNLNQWVHDNPSFACLGWEQWDGQYPTFSMTAKVGDIEYATMEMALEAANKTTGATITLLRHVTTSATLEIQADMTLDLNGHDLDANGGLFSVITVAEGVEFTLKDSNRSNIRYGYWDNGIYTIVALEEKPAVGVPTTELRGGIIRGSLASFGGGVYVDDGATFHMEGGVIAENAAVSGDGGGVYVYSATADTVFTMGGTAIITGNKSANSGGGVHLGNHGPTNDATTTFTIGGDATISNNDARRYGGGVCLANGGIKTFTMEGNGKITDNSAVISGGGVCMDSNSDASTFTMANNTKITGNHSGNGGGVWCKNTLTVGDNATISDNISFRNGGGVYLQQDDYGHALVMHGGTITRNKATSNGGGVYANDSSIITLSGNPTIQGNINGNLCLCPAVKIGFGEAGFTSDAVIGITTLFKPEVGTPVGFADEGKDHMGCFVSDSKLYEVISPENTIGLALAVDETVKVYPVSGIIHEDVFVGSGINVTIMYGKEIIDSTHTSDDGSYFFDNIPVGIYNIVATRGDKVVTIAVAVLDTAIENANATLKDYSSKLEVTGANTPNVVVGGLEAVNDGKNIILTVKSEAENETDSHIAIQEKAPGKTLEYLDITLKDDVNTNLGNDNHKVLEIIVPYPVDGKQGLTVYRYHDTVGVMPTVATAPDGSDKLEAEAFAMLKEKPVANYEDGTCFVDEENGLIYIYAMKFSTYAVGYDEKTPSIGGSGAPTTYKSTLANCQNGTVTLSDTKNKLQETVIVTATPDAGYVVGDVVVTYGSGRNVVVTDNGDGTYTYGQPGATATVTVTFVAEESWPFVDVITSHWFYDPVKYVYEAGMMTGTAPTCFSPNGSTTRGMIATILYRLEGSPKVGDMSFEDVATDMYYYDAIAWAQEHGIVTGYSDTIYQPDQNITREQLAAILFRYANYLELDVSVGESTNILSYQDSFEISEYAIPAIQWMCGAGLMEGKGEGYLAPQGQATRAEVATMLMRFLAD